MKVFHHLLAFCFVNVMAVAALHTLPTNTKVYIRNLLFSDILSDTDLSSETDVERRLGQAFLENARASATYDSFINTGKLNALSDIRDKEGTGTNLAVSIASMLGPPPTGNYCGTQAIHRIVENVENGKGCCSDYSKAFIAYAARLGLRSREVYVLSHSTVEYYDAVEKRWIWLDPYFGSQITNEQGKRLSIYQIRAASRFDHLQLLDLPPRNDTIPAFKTFRGYDIRQYGLLIYKKGNNFLDYEELEKKISWLGLPKSAFQFVAFVAGTHPGYIILTTEGIGEYLKDLKNIILTFLLCYTASNVAWLGRIIYGTISRRSAR